MSWFNLLAMLCTSMWDDSGSSARTLRQTCANPPSTNSSTPVMKLASSDARNTTALAISSGLPSRPIGTAVVSAFSRCCPVSDKPISSPNPGVSIDPGDRRAGGGELPASLHRQPHLGLLLHHGVAAHIFTL